MIRIILLAFMLSGCGQQVNDFINKRMDEHTPDPRSGKDTSEDLQPYVEEFAELLIENEMGSYLHALRDTPVWLTEIDKEGEAGGKVIGICYTWTSNLKKFREVTVNREWFEKHQDDEAAVRQLIEHELGHCVLGRGHIKEVKDDGYPVSIMFPMHFSVNHYDENYEYYVEELLNGENL
jgi:hypothetical protein